MIRVIDLPVFRLWIGLVALFLASCAAKSQPPENAGTQARVGSVILQLEPTSGARPALPDEARAQGIVGPVLVEIRISEGGDVSVLRVVRGHPLLNDLATAAVAQWKYPPTIFEGRPIPVVAVAAVSFVPRIEDRPIARRQATAGDPCNDERLCG